MNGLGAEVDKRINLLYILSKGQELYNEPETESKLLFTKEYNHGINWGDPVVFNDVILATKNKKRAVCVINTSESTDRQLEITRPAIRDYAKMCDADYIELTGDQFPEYPMYNKFRLHSVAKAYDKTLYLDCDIIINLEINIPNIFEETPDDKISAMCEESFLPPHLADYLHNETKYIKDNFLKIRYGKKENLLNGGVLVIPKCLADNYKQPDKKYPQTWCFDQVLLSVTVRNELLNILDHKWNYSIKHVGFAKDNESAYFKHINSPHSTRLQSLNWHSTKNVRGIATSFGCLPTKECSHQRSGWNIICQELKGINSDKGIYLDATLENSFQWKYELYEFNGHVPYLFPWAGFFHNPPNTPSFYEKRSKHFITGMEDNISSKQFISSIDYCVSLFTLSPYLAKSLKDRLEVPVRAIKHPILENNVPMWNPEAAWREKELAMLGYWYRKFSNFTKLRTNFKKSFLGGRVAELKYWLNLEKLHLNLNFNENDFMFHSPFNIPDFDDKLTKVVVFLDFWDTAFNTSVMDCISRNTPMIICKHEGVMDYLGKDYPLYFESLEEAEYLANNFDKIVEGHKYLENMDKSDLTLDNFLKTLRVYLDF